MLRERERDQHVGCPGYLSEVGGSYPFAFSVLSAVRFKI